MAAGLVIALATIPCIWFVDTDISTLLSSIDLPGDLDKAVQVSEVFAHGIGVFAILATIWWIDIPRRRLILYAGGMTLLSSLFANSLKAVFSRVRPHSSDSVESLESWLPLFHGSFWDSTQRSFPSGHAATAVGLAIGLSIVYPRGKFFFAFFAVLACLQRIVSQAHYPSDVLAGIAIACLCCAIWMIWIPREL
jgi:membrane-associated phospholipid phosphatase